MSVRILGSSPLVGPALADLGARFPDLHLAPFRSPEWNAALPQAEALVVLVSEPLTETDLDAAPKLKAIGAYSVGLNHVPVAACRDRGIAVVNTPGVLTDATADLALALLMALTRRLAEGEALVRSGTWEGWAPDQLLGRGLAGKDCGILGSGPIGQAFARRVWALGMRPIFWDREGLGGEVDFGPDRAPRLPLADLLPGAEQLCFLRESHMPPQALAALLVRAGVQEAAGGRAGGEIRGASLRYETRRAKPTMLTPPLLLLLLLLLPCRTR